MGLRMARRAASSGFDVAGFDVRPERVRLLTEAGGVGAGSGAEAVAGRALVVLMVRDGAEAHAALLGAGGLAAAMAPGAVVVLMSTVGPAAARTLGDGLREVGIDLVDAPVSGGAAGAEAGTLAIMAGGPQAAFERARPLLEALGGFVRRFGERPGDGQSIKLVNQLLCGVHLAAAGEALAFAEALGLSAAATLELVTQSSAASFMLSERGPRMIASDFDRPRGALALFAKDLELVDAAARERGFAAPLAAAAEAAFAAGVAAGFGELDDAAIIEVRRGLGARPEPDGGGSATHR
jgi:3-hydroxyisobutyrate dehydrogenase/putative dehydrogenase